MYHYDLNGKLIAETQPNGTPVRAYVYADDVPVAQVTKAALESLVYLHADPLAVPRLATDAAQRVVWRWEGEAFGGWPPDTDPDGDGKRTVVNLRFGGMYADSETGLYYWNSRYYDPRIGRGIQPDRMSVVEHVQRWRVRMGTPNQAPLELNPYLYASANPLRWIDPSGLYDCTYSISDHIMSCTPNVPIHAPFESSNFISGNNNGLGPVIPNNTQNNPGFADVPFVGPIPPGDYAIGPQRLNSSRRDLSPDMLNDMFGRSAFQTHGCGNPATCSEGCVGATTNSTRDRFNSLMKLEEGNNTLRVVP